MAGKKYLYLGSREESYRINKDSIVYFEADGNYTRFVLCSKQEGMIAVNLGKVDDILAEELGSDAQIFIRASRKYIINWSYLYRICVLKGLLILSDGFNFEFKLKVPSTRLRQLKDLLEQGRNKYLPGKHESTSATARKEKAETRGNNGQKDSIGL